MDLPKDFSIYVENVMMLIEKGYLPSNVNVEKIATSMYNNEMKKLKVKDNDTTT
jgi:hypothetical protein